MNPRFDSSILLQRAAPYSWQLTLGSPALLLSGHYGLVLTAVELLLGLEPVGLRRSFGTASGDPEFVSQSCNFARIGARGLRSHGPAWRCGPHSLFEFPLHIGLSLLVVTAANRLRLEGGIRLAASLMSCFYLD